MATDLISVFLIKKEPFSLRFPYIFRLLDFFFDTEYYAFLILNSLTLIHFRRLARPLQFLLFCFSLKTNWLKWFISTDASLTTTTAIHRSMKNSRQRFWLDVFSHIDSQFTSENIHAKKKKKKNNNNNCYGNRNIKQFKFIVDYALLPAR